MSFNERKYVSTHSWIKFELDMREVSYALWLLLGAAESKCKHLAGIPLRPQKQDELNRISLTKGIRATTAIEGNTLSEADIGKIMQGQEHGMPRSRGYQVQEVKNMLILYNAVVYEVKNTGLCEISLRQLKADNAGILSGLELEEDEQPGDIRNYSVAVADYRGAPAQDCEYLLCRLVEWLSSDWGLGSEHRIVEGILKAITAHLYIAWIHPFGNGNGRGARLMEFRLLMNAGVPLIAAHLLTSHYNDTREEYYGKLRQSSRVQNGELAFIEYAVQGFVDSLDSEIASILDEQLDVTWENYVGDYFFSGTQTAAQRRRRELLLHMSKYSRPVLLNELKYRLPNGVLKQYQGSVRMLSRDVNYLLKSGLVYASGEGYMAAKDKMKAFLPLSTASRNEGQWRVTDVAGLGVVAIINT